MTLEELLSKYKIFGFSDYEIIKLFFIENHCEEFGIKLLTELSQERIKFLREKNSRDIEHYEYIKAILFNPIPQEDALKLFSLATTMTYHRDLNEEELKTAADILNKNKGKIFTCPNYFIAYLVEKGVYEHTVYDYFKKDLENIIKFREGN